jgi:hypothetical protein
MNVVDCHVLEFCLDEFQPLKPLADAIANRHVKRLVRLTWLTNEGNPYCTTDAAHRQLASKPRRSSARRSSPERAAVNIWQAWSIQRRDALVQEASHLAPANPDDVLLSHRPTHLFVTSRSPR